MLEMILNYNQLLHAIGFYPEVAMAVIAGFFLAHAVMGYDSRRASLVVIGLSVIAEFAFAYPSTFQGVLMGIVMGVLQAGLGIGLYWMADEANLPEKLASILGKKLDKKASEEDAPK